MTNIGERFFNAAASASALEALMRSGAEHGAVADSAGAVTASAGTPPAPAADAPAQYYSLDPAKRAPVEPVDGELVTRGSAEEMVITGTGPVTREVTFTLRSGFDVGAEVAEQLKAAAWRRAAGGGRRASGHPPAGCSVAEVAGWHAHALHRAGLGKSSSACGAASWRSWASGGTWNAWASGRQGECVSGRTGE